MWANILFRQSYPERQSRIRVKEALANQKRLLQEQRRKERVEVIEKALCGFGFVFNLFYICILTSQLCLTAWHVHVSYLSDMMKALLISHEKLPPLTKTMQMCKKKAELEEKDMESKGVIVAQLEQRVCIYKCIHASISISVFYVTIFRRFNHISS